MAKPTDIDRLHSAWSHFRWLVNHTMPSAIGSLRRARGRLPR